LLGFNPGLGFRSVATIRVVWKQIRMNMGLVRVVAVSVDRIQDGCKSGRSHNIPESVPEDHTEALDTQVQLDLLDRYTREQRMVFPQFDLERNVNPDPVDPEEAREGDV